MEAQGDSSDELLKLFLEPEVVLKGESKITSNPDMDYIKKGFNSCRENIKEIDATINRFSDKWSTSRMPKTDLAIMRLAVTEIKYMDEIPDAVAVDEAVEIAKKFAGEDSPKFINGILGEIIKEKNE